MFNKTVFELFQAGFINDKIW